MRSFLVGENDTWEQIIENTRSALAQVSDVVTPEQTRLQQSQVFSSLLSTGIGKQTLRRIRGSYTEFPVMTSWREYRSPFVRHPSSLMEVAR